MVSSVFRHELVAPAELVEPPSEIEAFSLLGSDGHPFTKSSLIGAWTVVMIGYTYCPDVCPSTLTVLKVVAKRLEDSARPPKFVLLSVDPQRDRPDRLQQYVTFFNPDFVAATGMISEIDKLARGLGFTYERVEGAYPGSYTMDHSTSLFLVDPKARLVGRFAPPFQAEALAKKLRELIAAGD